MKSILLTLSFSVIWLALLLTFVRAADDRPTGFFLELGPRYESPVAGNIVGNVDPLAGFQRSELHGGWGADVSFGYDGKYIGFGPRFHWAYLRTRPADFLGIGLPGQNFKKRTHFGGIDLVMKLYILDWFSIPTGPIRPYGLVGAGGGMMAGNAVDGGLETVFGGGVQVQLGNHFYIAGQGTYESLYGGNTCSFLNNGGAGLPLSVCQDNNVKNLVGSALVGLRF